MKDNKLKIEIAFSLILLVVGIALLLQNFISDNRDKVFSQMNLEITELLKSDEQAANQLREGETTSNEGIANETIDTNYEMYAGILEIPKIGFSRGFYKIESSLNNVKFNIKILENSSYPDEEHGNVIIIGHSGNYSNSYFANLYQLNVGDEASITYEENKYTYRIINIYQETKDGTVTIYRDEEKDCLTLITCTKDDDNHQTVYIFEKV